MRFNLDSIAIGCFFGVLGLVIGLWIQSETNGQIWPALSALGTIAAVFAALGISLYQQKTTDLREQTRLSVEAQREKDRRFRATLNNTLSAIHTIKRLERLSGGLLSPNAAYFKVDVQKRSFYEIYDSWREFLSAQEHAELIQFIDGFVGRKLIAQLQSALIDLKWRFDEADSERDDSIEIGNSVSILNTCMTLNSRLAKKFYYSEMVKAAAEGIAVTDELSEPEGILDNAIGEELQILERLQPVVEDLQ